MSQLQEKFCEDPDFLDAWTQSDAVGPKWWITSVKSIRGDFFRNIRVAAPAFLGLPGQFNSRSFSLDPNFDGSELIAELGSAELVNTSLRSLVQLCITHAMKNWPSIFDNFCRDARVFNATRVCLITFLKNPGGAGRTTSVDARLFRGTTLECAHLPDELPPPDEDVLAIRGLEQEVCTNVV